MNLIKKSIIALSGILFAVGVNAQSTNVYYLTGVTGQTSSCGNGHFYNVGGGNNTLSSWTSTECGNVTSVVIETRQGVMCNTSGTFYLNNVNQGGGSFINNCTCTPTTYTRTKTLTPANYNVGGTNSVRVFFGSHAGFSRNAAWGNAYARVIVTYDDQNPLASVANIDQTAECSLDLTAYAPTATDCDDGTITGTTSDNLDFTDKGTYTVNWDYTDSDGNTVTQVQNITVNDVTAPALDNATLADAQADCMVDLNGQEPTATDNCDGAITAYTNDPMEYTTEGSHYVTWIFEDEEGNTNTQGQWVIINDDTEEPVLNATNIDVTRECSANLIPPTAEDNCKGTMYGVTNDPLYYNQIGVYNVTWTFDDNNGNVVTQDQVVTIDPSTLALSVTKKDAAQNDTEGEINLDVTGGSGAFLFDWDNDGTGDFDDAQNLTGVGVGTYTVVVLDAYNGCEKSITVEVGYTAIGVDELDANAFSLYPNPTTGVVNVVFSNATQNTTVRLKNMLGQTIETKLNVSNKTTFDLSDYSNGIYFIEVENNGAISTSKLVKK